MPWAQSSPLASTLPCASVQILLTGEGWGGIDDPGRIFSLLSNVVEPRGTLSCKDLAAA